MGKSAVLFHCYLVAAIANCIGVQCADVCRKCTSRNALACSFCSQTDRCHFFQESFPACEDSINGLYALHLIGSHYMITSTLLPVLRQVYNGNHSFAQTTLSFPVHSTSTLPELDKSHVLNVWARRKYAQAASASCVGILDDKPSGDKEYFTNISIRSSPSLLPSNQIRRFDITPILSNPAISKDPSEWVKVGDTTLILTSDAFVPLKKWGTQGVKIGAIEVVLCY
eukprot:Blabericola_migrator_1__3080@NODE_189_length_11671_cov_137_497242_g164_i0_p7_GENE_NODE_189_length_11671_cov_137_497242_g164_i0NODE_189_length_11671_cov_137_497242_g164_i0_p7_ORF_typecomplete_len226_score10_14_NODE_189_length_11671_cov_137_497242_g164_i058126489